MHIKFTNASAEAEKTPDFPICPLTGNVSGDSVQLLEAIINCVPTKAYFRAENAE